MFDFTAITKIKQTFDEFKAKNPDVMEFAEKVSKKGFVEGQEFVISVKYPDNTEYKADFTVQKDDLQLLNTLNKFKF